MEIHAKQIRPDDQNRANRARMLISCPDGPGIVAAVSHFCTNTVPTLYSLTNIRWTRQAACSLCGSSSILRNWRATWRSWKQILPMWQHVSRWNGPFLPLAAKRLAIFVSKEDHCLVELLWQWQAGDLDADIALVVSNHLDMKDYVESFGIPYHHIPVTADTKRSRAAPAGSNRQRCGCYYSRPLYADYLSMFIEHYRNRIINIHHSFLPAFVGGKPYAQAYNRGVKIIGATAHYVTEELDGGPIIEQDVQRVSHGDNVTELKRIGRTIERVVLARAVKWHVEDRVLVHENKTVVF